MSVPARKKSSSSVRRRRSHFRVSKTDLGACEKCQAPVKSHYACKSCGFYKGRKVVDTDRKTARVLSKLQAKGSKPEPQSQTDTKTSQE